MSSHPLARAVEGVQERTVSGALITGGCVLLILSLLTGELSSYFSPALIHHLGVENQTCHILFWGSSAFSGICMVSWVLLKDFAFSSLLLAISF